MSLPRGCRNLFLALMALSFAAVAAIADDVGPVVAVLDIDGAIGPATSDYVVRGLDDAQGLGAAAVVLRMNTPGGLDTSMREIIQAVLSSPVAVIGYVAPNGARAASAGTYILYATPLSAMAPATNLGAATPIAIGGFPTPDEGTAKEDGEEKPAKQYPGMEDKAVNDAVAYIRSLADLHGRNAEWAAKAVTEAASLSAKDALEAGVIDMIAESMDGLLAAADGRSVKVLDGQHVLRTAGADIVVLAPDWRTRFLATITTPTLAYILLLMGIYGIIFEFWNPGFTGPGVIGAIALLIALFALHLMPVNYAGLGLIVLGAAFMIAEAFMPAFGILGIGGVIAFVVGSIMLMDTDVPGFQVSWPVIASLAGASASLFLISLVLLTRSRHRPAVGGLAEMIGLEGVVIDWNGNEGRVRTRGEIWHARASSPLEPGAAVSVTAMDGLVLTVRPKSQGGTKP